MGTSLNPVKRPCKPSQTAVLASGRSLRLIHRCVLLPLGSPTGPQERVFEHVPTFGYALVSGWVRAGMGNGWVPGWVYRVGNTGVPAPRTSHSEAEQTPAKRAPEGPAGLEWVGVCTAPRDVRHPPLRGPVSTLQVPPWCLLEQMPPPGQ